MSLKPEDIELTDDLLDFLVNGPRYSGCSICAGSTTSEEPPDEGK